MIKCSICGKTFTYKKGMYGHKRFIHEQDKYPKIKRRNKVVEGLKNTMNVLEKSQTLKGLREQREYWRKQTSFWGTNREVKKMLEDLDNQINELMGLEKEKEEDFNIL